MRKRQWLIVSVFLIISIVIIAPFFLQANQPIDEHQLQLQAQSVQALTSEAITLIDQKDRQTPFYFQTHREDLQKKIADMTKEMEQKPYDPSIKDKRERLIKRSHTIASQLSLLSLSPDNKVFLKKIQNELSKQKNEIRQK